jgi:hypothetical protein
MILYNVRFGSNRCAIFYELSFVLRVGLLPCMLIKYLSLSIYIYLSIYYTVSILSQMMMKQQDEGLEMLGQSAERLSKISMGIHEELGHQNK